MTFARRSALASAAALALLQIPLPGHAAAASASPPGAAACAALLNRSIAGATLLSAQYNAATDALPEHCELVGSIRERTGQDGQPYAIKLHLRLPTAWTQRLLYQGGGGSDGNLGSADASQLALGYAVVSTDSGHDNAVNLTPLAGTLQFGMDPQARSDYGYNGPFRTAVAAKAIAQAYYGRLPAHSYFSGCSEGGREGLMFSQRYPGLFDGIVAGNPGMDLPKAAVAEAWDSQALAQAARSQTPLGHPDLASAFSNEELSALGSAITQACDAQDGLADGMLFNPEACRFDPASLGPQGSGVLSAAQVTALQKVFGGAVNSQGQALYAGWYWDPGVASPGWRFWKMGIQPAAPGNSALNLTLGGGSLPFVFTTPPNTATAGTALGGSTQVTTAGPNPSSPGLNDAFVPWMLSFSMDLDAPKIYARDSSSGFHESAMDFMGTSRTDYRRFQALGGKLIVYTGQADPVFSSLYHLRWYEQLAQAQGGYAATQRFARLYRVPGMNHCGGGPATSQFDALSAVVKWVEQGSAPQSLLATAPADTPWPGRTRPLCAYPAQARYLGSGSIEDAANFACVRP